MTLKQSIHLIIAIFILILSGDYARMNAAVSSVTLTAVDSPTTLTNGHAYFLAGRDYTFRVQAEDVTNTLADWGTITLRINNGATTVASTGAIDISSTPAAAAVTTESNMRVTNLTWDVTPPALIECEITIRLLWNNTVGDFAEGVNTVSATVTDDDVPLSTTDTINLAFGMSTHVDIYNMAANGDAADGRINPYHLAFTVTGSEVIYYVQDAVKAGSADTVRSLAVKQFPVLQAGDAEITGTTLFYDAGSTGLTDNDETDSLTYSVAQGTFSVTGDHLFSVRVNMATGGATTTSVTPLPLNVNRVQVTDVEFINGGGVDSPYYRSVHFPGTEIRITVRLENDSPSLGGNRNMRGDTIVGIQCQDAGHANIGTPFTMTIGSGSNRASVLVPFPVEGNITDYTTAEMHYDIVSITGSDYDDEQDSAARISQLSNPVVLWDDNDPPGINGAAADYDGDAPGTNMTPFTSGVSGVVYNGNTATSLSFVWTPLTAAYPCYDGDFLTYRIYYKRHSDAVWTIVDMNAPGFGPGETYNLSLISTGAATISGMDPFTEYDFFITALDVFGQEVDWSVPGTSDALHINNAQSNIDGYSTVITNPLQVDVTVTDGITTYINTDFNGDPPVPANRPLRDSAIRVNLYWASSAGAPDDVFIILSDYPGASNLVTSGEITPGLVEGTDYDRIECKKVSPNVWAAYISSENRYLATGNDVRFIIESILNGRTSYVDHDSDTDPAEQLAGSGNPNDIEWTFRIETAANFTPWPARMLNNVITDDNPVSYPSYYLTNDAYVTITAYDIKGRPVAVLLENALRPAGQNIKEDGWGGTNKNRKKLGVGLYYIHIYARRADNGKVIINKYSKIVVAK